MKTLLKFISFIGLMLTIAPSFLVFTGAIDLAYHKTLMLIGTAVWFASAPFWISKEAK